MGRSLEGRKGHLAGVGVGKEGRPPMNTSATRHTEESDLLYVLHAPDINTFAPRFSLNGMSKRVSQEVYNHSRTASSRLCGTPRGVLRPRFRNHRPFRPPGMQRESLSSRPLRSQIRVGQVGRSLPTYVLRMKATTPQSQRLR